jgi:hypothetical protein
MLRTAHHLREWQEYPQGLYGRSPIPGAITLPLYFFDTREDSRLTQDSEGQELSGRDAARAEATRGLVDLAKEALPGAFRRKLAVEVRDAHGDVLRASLSFEVATLTG